MEPNVYELRSECERLGIDNAGNKATLVARLGKSRDAFTPTRSSSRSRTRTPSKSRARSRTPRATPKAKATHKAKATPETDEDKALGAFASGKSRPGLFEKRSSSNANTNTNTNNPPFTSTLKILFDPSQPWLVLNNQGSYNNFFNFVPLEWRVGPWSRLAVPTLLFFLFKLVLSAPSKAEFSDFLQSNPLPDNYALRASPISNIDMSKIHLAIALNGLATLFLIVRKSSPAVFGTYTMISWLNITTHALATVAQQFQFQFISISHPTFHLALNAIRQCTRFPALVSALITFGVWNIVLAPYIYFIFCKGSESKTRFLKWNFSFLLMEIHFFNLPIAVAATLWNFAEFGDVDLWLASVLAYLYGLLYLLVFDRIGVHLYPTFSPRSSR